MAGEEHPLRMFGQGPQQVLDAMVGQKVLGYELDISAGADDEHDELLLILLDTSHGTTGTHRVRISAAAALVVRSEGVEAEGPPAITVERYGGIHTWTKVPLRGPRWLPRFVRRWWS